MSTRAALALALLFGAGSVGACSSDEASSRSAGGSGGKGSAGAGAAGAAGAGAGGLSGAGAGGAGAAGKAGAGGSAGTSAAGSGGMGGSPDPCVAALFCDDFEDHTADAGPGAPWTVETNADGEVVVATGMAASGSQALRVRTTGLNSYQRAFASLEGAPVFPAAKDVLWGRMMIYTQAAPDDGVHWTMIQGQGDVSGETYRSIIRYGGQHQQRLMANYETSGGPGSDCWHHSETEMPQGSWACMEWHYDGPADEMNFYLNGTLVNDLTVIGMNDPDNGDGCVTNDLGGVWHFPVFDKLSLGWESYQDDPAREIWIDDVAVGTERLSCP